MSLNEWKHHKLFARTATIHVTLLLPFTMANVEVHLDNTTSFKGEKTGAPNANSVREFEVIDTIKTQLESLF